MNKIEILAFLKILDGLVSKNRKQGFDFYQLYKKDDPFTQAFIDSMRRLVSSDKPNPI